MLITRKRMKNPSLSAVGLSRRQFLGLGGVGLASPALFWRTDRGNAQTPVASPVAPTSPLTNLEHLDLLGDQVTPPDQDGHTTYRLAREPELRTLWTYAEPNDDGSWKRVGGGEYDASVNTWGQGAFNTDDMTRASVVYVRHSRQTRSADSRAAAYDLLRTVAYMQTLQPGPYEGNFVLWMQPDGALNPSAEPKELPDPSDSGPSHWLARGIWALGEGYAAFKDDASFASFLQDRMELALDALERQVLVHYGEMANADGADVPAWLIADGADASAEAVYGLAAFVTAGGGDKARRALAQLAEGIGLMRQGDNTAEWPFGAILPWTRSRSMWQGWGDQMGGALATAGEVLAERSLVETAVDEAGTFTPHLLIQGGADQGWQPAPVDRSQIAYGADATLQNLMRVAVASRREAYRQLAGIAGAWYFGNNRSGTQMYDPSTGVTFDGLGADGSVNTNSGAESTIHGLLSMLELDAHPDVRAAAMVAHRSDQVIWQIVEAEAGTLEGDGHVVHPESAWTGESTWSGGAYVELGQGSRVTHEITLPVDGDYRLLPVFERQPVELQSIGTRHTIDGEVAGTIWHGGAGSPGITAVPGYLDIDNVGSARELAAGDAVLVSDYVGDGGPARLDAILIQPDVEHLLLTGESGCQGLVRNWGDTRRMHRMSLESDGRVNVFAYDAGGILVEHTEGEGGTLTVPVEPGGFTYLACNHG